MLSVSGLHILLYDLKKEHPAGLKDPPSLHTLFSEEIFISQVPFPVTITFLGPRKPGCMDSCKMGPLLFQHITAMSCYQIVYYIKDLHPKYTLQSQP